MQPDWSWFGANQLLSYLTVFAGGGRAGPARARTLARARWAAWRRRSRRCARYSLLAKVFPSTLASANLFGRLQAPFGYWNAIGLSAAMGLAPALWAATRRAGGSSCAASRCPP